MSQKTEEAILKVYFENPDKDFTVREMSKLTKIPRATVHKKIVEIRNEHYFKDEVFFKIKKINFYIEELFSSGVIRFLIDELNPSMIILFGSFKKGESNKNSDVDLFRLI